MFIATVILKLKKRFLHLSHTCTYLLLWTVHGLCLAAPLRGATNAIEQQEFNFEFDVVVVFLLSLLSMNEIVLSCSQYRYFTTSLYGPPGCSRSSKIDAQTGILERYLYLISPHIIPRRLQNEQGEVKLTIRILGDIIVKRFCILLFKTFCVYN